MHTENRTCQNCKTSFAIEPEDFTFYETMKVPPPTWCPPCRLQRRMTFTNERSLYSSACGLCKKSIITMYHPSAPFPVYCKQCWWSDAWDPLQYGRAYDFSRPFFEQLAELKDSVPRLNLVQEGTMEGSEYCNRATNNKNCYLCFRSTNNEDCLYSHPIVDSRDCVDCYSIQKSERCYECIDCVQMYHCIYCTESQNCTDSAFLYDCRGCSNCFGCVGLRNQQYHIFNTPYSAEEYKKKVSEMLSGSRSDLEKVQHELSRMRLSFIRPSRVASRSENISGNWIYDSSDTHNSFMCRNVEHGKNLYFIIEAKDCMDFFHFGRACERIYETANCGLQCSNIRFCNEVFMNCSDLTYCDASFSSSDCFGCVGLRKGRLSILNIQYSENAYRELVEKIVAHMNEMPYRDSKGCDYRFGEFLPSALSPVCYNESVVQEFFPLTKESAVSAGYRWRDLETKEIGITRVASGLPETMKEVDDSITKEIIGCAHEGTCNDQCTRGFKIMKKELEFYRAMNLPLPRLCPNCRHSQRHAQRPAVQLHRRSCSCAGIASQGGIYKNTVPHAHGSSPCSHQFETVYGPDHPNVVYCEECYQQEIA